MSVYAVANYRVTSPEGFADYAAHAGRTIAAHGGEALAVDRASIAVEGEPAPVVVLLRFPDLESLQGWYDSPEYQEIVALRTENTEGTMVFARGVAAAPGA
jgi:uncharacterized protein (DUF1330 family)